MHRETVFNHATHVHIFMPMKIGIVIGIASGEEGEGGLQMILILGSKYSNRTVIYSH